VGGSNRTATAGGRASTHLSSARLITRNTGVVAAGDALSKLASIAFYVVMARELGKHGLGDFMFALSIVLFIELAEFGTSTIVMREVARSSDESDGIYWGSLVVKLLVGALGAAVAVGVSLVGGYAGAVVAAVVLLSAAKVAELGMKNEQAVLRGLEDTSPVALSQIVQRFSTAAVGIVAMLAFGAGVVVVSAIYIGGTLLALAYVAWALERRRARPPVRVSRSQLMPVLRMSLPFGLSAIAITLFGRIDAAMLSFMKGNVDVGVYGAAYRVFDGTLFLSWAFGLALLPSFARLDRDTIPTIGAALEAGAKVVTVVLFPIGAVMALFARPVILLAYGHAFEAAVVPAQILGGAIALYGVFFVASNVLLAHDRQRDVIVMSTAVAVANIALNLALIPPLSARGAALAMTVSQAMLTAMAVAFTARVTGPLSLPRVAAGPVAGVAAMALVAGTIGTGWGGLVAALVAYPLAVAGLEARLHPADLRLLRGALTRRASLRDA
jgi:O-antigen/teichoic acid export membrane protein